MAGGRGGEMKIGKEEINFERFDLQAEQNSQIYTEYIIEKTKIERQITDIKSQIKKFVEDNSLF